ncbi:MAG: membrane protein [Fimbriimonadales bacterium]|nr:MAG: membrane protein [Fimbriimonadales bacterium]GIV10826.1 MAG: membrane protein [Fimbriimonadales bacterium]
MTLEIALTLGLLVAAVALFISNRFPPEIVALILLATLLLSGLIPIEKGLRGFSNDAVITIAAMFVLSEGLQRTGFIGWIARGLEKLARRAAWLAVGALLLLTALLSAFVNNTAVVALFIPLTLALSESARRSPSRLLLPLSYASMLGGVCTLIGTSTNLIVNGVAQARGIAPLGMFEFTPLGILFTSVGLAYLFLIGMRLLPERRPAAALADAYQLSAYITEVELTAKSKAVGRRLIDADFVKELGVEVLGIWRNKVRLLPLPDRILQEGDLLRVRCNLQRLQQLQGAYGLKLVLEEPSHAEPEPPLLVELVLTPSSSLVGETLRTSRFRNRFGATVLALRHRQAMALEQFADTPLEAGDAILVQIERDRLPELLRLPDFILVSQVEAVRPRPLKALLAGLIMAGVVTVASLGWYPTSVTALTGALLMILTSCLKPDQAVQSIDWRLLIMLGAMLGLGTAMETTGAARWLTTNFIGALGALGPIVALSGFYLLTSLLTEVMSNNATAVLMAALGIEVAAALGVDARPFLFAVAYAASTSFMTPIGYQTNTMVFGVGQYQFSDFVRVGAPLNILFWILATLLIPRFWGF